MAKYQSSFGKPGQGVAMGKVNPKADGKFYRGSFGAPHVLELLYANHVEKEEQCSATHATRHGSTYTVQSFGPGGSIVEKRVTKIAPPEELTNEEKRAKKINKAVLHVLRKEGFGNVRKELKELKRLREEQDRSIAKLEASIPRLSNTLRRLA